MVEIKREDDGVKGKFLLFYNDSEAGYMTYNWAGDDKIIIDDTFVKKEFGGKGLGKKLVLAAVDYARDFNIKIIPVCPFAKSVLTKDKELADVLYT